MAGVIDLAAVRHAATLTTLLLEHAAPGHTHLEIRCQSADDWPAAYFDDPAAAAVHAVASSAGGSRGVFVGAAPRTANLGATRGGNDDVSAVGVLWADCDTAEAVAALNAFPVQPLLRVTTSPGRQHAYWPLIAAVPAEHARDAMRRLASHLGADVKCANPGRILRVPGTWNRKRTEPFAVQAIDGVGLAVDLEDLLAPLPAPPAPAPVRVPRPSGDVRRDELVAYMRSIPASTYVPALTGRELRQGFVRCPFHGGGDGERTPSLHVGGRDASAWYCHGCEEGGGIFDLVARLRGFDARRDFPAVVRATVELIGGAA